MSPNAALQRDYPERFHASVMNRTPSQRTAFVALELFIELNGHELVADDADCVVTMLAVPAGEMDETTLAEWVRERLAVASPKR